MISNRWFSKKSFFSENAKNHTKSFKISLKLLFNIIFIQDQRPKIGHIDLILINQGLDLYQTSLNDSHGHISTLCQKIYNNTQKYITK